jgi:hypothetical protein
LLSFVRANLFDPEGSGFGQQTSEQMGGLTSALTDLLGGGKVASDRMQQSRAANLRSLFAQLQSLYGETGTKTLNTAVTGFIPQRSVPFDYQGLTTAIGSLYKAYASSSGYPPPSSWNWSENNVGPSNPGAGYDTYTKFD